jgi:hypothetical protein
MSERPQPPYNEPTTDEPDVETIEEWFFGGYCLATDGCKVEPDGWCPHGYVSWMIQMGLI